MYAFHDHRWLDPYRQSAAAFLLTVLFVGLLAGCEVPQPPPTQADATTPEPKYVDPDSEAGQRLAQAQVSEQAVSSPLTASPTRTDAASETAAKAGQLVEAKKGVGKWKPYQPGLVTTPLNAYFSVRQTMKFNQVTHGLKIFHAQHGRKPKNFAEVEKEVIKPAAITLPELQEGDQYVYMPDEGPDGALMVMRLVPE
ncbi:MAG: hypothetical protein OES79_17205 [Planctomycetota bacterium]|nr:hypothetical protein [Planctomycetota bacterium]